MKIMAMAALGILSATPATEAMARTVRVAVSQIFVVDSDREGNFRRIEDALEVARAGNADIATFPESAILGWENPDAHRMATPIPGADSDRIATLAKKFGLMISIGLDEKDGDRLYDSAILVDKTGTILWKHRKLNVLPQLMDPPYSVGDPAGIGSVATGFGRIGVLICADTMAKEPLACVDRLDPKPDLMLVPYGWVAELHEWPEHAKSLETLVANIAKRWGAAVVGTDAVGAMTHGPWSGRTYGGASVVAGADGSVLAVLRDRNVEVRLVDVPLPRRDDQSAQ